jgi:hypothetical protein
VAQNARQEPDDYYAYTQYDPLGRVTEAGEIKNTTAMTEATAQDDDDLASWLNTVNIRDRIVTTYDFPCDSTSEAQFPGGKQEHLRGRVACVKYYDEDNTPAKTALSPSQACPRPTKAQIPMSMPP